MFSTGNKELNKFQRRFKDFTNTLTSFFLPESKNTQFPLKKNIFIQNFVLNLQSRIYFLIVIPKLEPCFAHIYIYTYRGCDG